MTAGAVHSKRNLGPWEARIAQRGCGSAGAGTARRGSWGGYRSWKRGGRGLK